MILNNSVASVGGEKSFSFSAQVLDSAVANFKLQYATWDLHHTSLSCIMYFETRNQSTLLSPPAQ